MNVDRIGDPWRNFKPKSSYYCTKSKVFPFTKTSHISIVNWRSWRQVRPRMIGVSRFSINRPTKRGKEKSPSDGHCQCQKEKGDHLLACQQFLTENHIVTRLANELASFLNLNDINDISFFETSDCYHCCSIAWMLILWYLLYFLRHTQAHGSLCY
jgi:hypothetical protein